MKRLVAGVACVLAACATSPNVSSEPTPVASPSAPTAAPTATQSPTAATQVFLAGTVTTADTEGGQYAAFTAGGALYAIWTRDGPAPYLSRLMRYDVVSKTWVIAYETAAAFIRVSPLGARTAVIEYREPPLGGGASDQRVAVVDLASGTSQTIDAFSLSAKTFRGGGGGPRRPGSAVVLSDTRVAWTRTNELADGEIEGELRVAAVNEPSRAVTIARSREWIEPLWLDGARLIYLVGGADRDDVRARDLASGADRSLVTALAPRMSAGRAGMARSGDVIAWIDNPSVAGAPDARPGDPTRATLRTFNIATGASRDLDLAATYCVALSGNARGLVWSCPSKVPDVITLSYFDPRTWKSVDIARSSARANDLAAVDGGFLWFDLVNGLRRANLLVLR